MPSEPGPELHLVGRVGTDYVGQVELIVWLLKPLRSW